MDQLRFVKNLEDSFNIENISRFGRDFSIVRVPYTFQIIITRIEINEYSNAIITDKNVDQVIIFNSKRYSIVTFNRISKYNCVIRI